MSINNRDAESADLLERQKKEARPGVAQRQAQGQFLFPVNDNITAEDAADPDNDTEGMDDDTEVEDAEDTKVQASGQFYIAASDGKPYCIDFGSPNTSKYLQASSSLIYNVTTEDFWMAGMFKRTSDSGTFETLARKATGVLGYLARISSSDQLQALVIDASGATTVTLTSPTVSTGVWYAWAFSADRNGNGTVYLYNMDTATLSSQSTDISSREETLSNTQTFTVGRNSAASDQFFPGQMDNLIPPQIGQTLTQAQFLEYATTGAIGGVVPTNVYHFEQNTKDNINGQYNLTAFGSPTFVESGHNLEQELVVGFGDVG